MSERLAMREVIDITPEEEAADVAVQQGIESLAREHKPDHLVFTLGVLFAQGLAESSENYCERALDEFIRRLQKHCGIELKRAGTSL